MKKRKMHPLHIEGNMLQSIEEVNLDLRHFQEGLEGYLSKYLPVIPSDPTSTAVAHSTGSWRSNGTQTSGSIMDRGTPGVLETIRKKNEMAEQEPSERSSCTLNTN